MPTSSLTCCVARASPRRILDHVSKSAGPAAFGTPFRWSARLDLVGRRLNATAIWAAKLGMNLQSSTLKNDESGEPFHVQQAAQIRAYRAAWKKAGHPREPRIWSTAASSRWSTVATAPISATSAAAMTRGDLLTRTRARSLAAATPPSRITLIEPLKNDEAIAEADTLLLTVPNQLGVAYNAHVIELF